MTRQFDMRRETKHRRRIEDANQVTAAGERAASSSIPWPVAAGRPRIVRSAPPRSDGEALLVGEQLLLGLEQELVGLEQLLGPHPHLVGQPLALVRLGLEHLLILDLDDGLVGDRPRRQDEPQLLRLADDRARDLVEPDVPVVGPALLRDALGLADVELDDLVAALTL